MSISCDTLQNLCLEGESNRLDYKQAQYRFIGATDGEKVELLKDVLAMANSFRKDSAFILIGVKEQESGTGEVIGIEKGDIIDDATLQEFVNGKTNRVIPFKSYTVSVEGKMIQVIEIAVCNHEKPFFLKKKYFSILLEQVMIRIGSSTKIASPDMIKKMGQEDIRESSMPELTLEFSSPNFYKSNQDLAYMSPCCELEEKEEVSSEYMPEILRPPTPQSQLRWLKDVMSVLRLTLKLKNISEVQADNLKVTVTVPESSCRAQVENNFGEYFRSQFDYLALTKIKPAQFRDDCLRPGEEDTDAESIDFKVSGPGTITIHVQILGKNILPIEKDFNFNVLELSCPLNEKDINIFCRAFNNEDSYWSHIYRWFNPLSDTTEEHEGT